MSDRPLSERGKILLYPVGKYGVVHPHRQAPKPREVNDEIAALEAENERLVEALKDVARGLVHAPDKFVQDAYDRALDALEEGCDSMSERPLSEQAWDAFYTVYDDSVPHHNDGSGPRFRLLTHKIAALEAALILVVLDRGNVHLDDLTMRSVVDVTRERLTALEERGDDE